MRHTILHDAIKRITLRPYQGKLRADIEHQWALGKSNVLAVLPTGGGKCLGRDTPVLMFDGTVKMVQDIRIGDKLMGPDSSPRTVRSLARGQEMMYRVVPVKGEPYIVNENHILSLKKTAEFHGDPRHGEIVNISVKDYLSKSEWFKHIHKGWRTGVEWPSTVVPDELSPYMLGVWLGDGSSAGAAITSADDEIVDFIKTFCASTGHNLRIQLLPDNAASTYCMSTSYRREGSMLAALRRYNLINNKHIPTDYKITSSRQRLELLAGILDSDGYLHHGHYDVVFKSEQLSHDLAFLARSLGFACYVKPCRKTCTNNGVTGDYFRLIISGDVSRIPTILKRHQPDVRQQKKSVLVTGIRLERLTVGDYYGFEIDGDHLFMLGDFTVTHNTATFSDIIFDEPGATCAIAHRQELVGQISLALARNGVRHRIVGPKSVVKMVVRLHMEELGASYYDPSSRHAVAGVDTLIRRHDQLASWLPTVKLWVMDEAHHVLRANKWGKAVEMFPNARGLGVTAWPGRADGMGLGRHADGVMDAMVVGPTQRQLIGMGFLTPYKLFAPPSTFNRDTIKVSDTTGDFVASESSKAVATSSLVTHNDGQIVGDVVKIYKKLLDGLLTIVFAPDVKVAYELEAQYLAAGIPAKCVHGAMEDDERINAVRDFRKRKLLVLINVALFDEGFDLPAIEAVQDVAATQSKSRFIQRAGRMLRILEGKLFGIYVDHVGNIAQHATVVHYHDKSEIELCHYQGLTLDRRERRSAGKSDAEPVRNCVKCTAPFPRFMDACPYCGEPIPEPAERSAPEFVDGDLHELDPNALAQLRAGIAQVDMSPQDYRDQLTMQGVPQVGVMANVKRHIARQEAVAKLRESEAVWAGYERAAGLSDSEIMRKFYHIFKVDLWTAQTWKADEMLALCERIDGSVRNAGTI